MTSFKNLIEITDKLDSLLSLIEHHSSDQEMKNCIGIAWDFNYDLRAKLFKLKSELATDEPVIAAAKAPLSTPYDSSLSIGARIQLARENLSLTEADIARELGIYSDHISDWECGITELPAGMILPLASTIKCDPLWLLGDFDGVEPPALTETPLAPVKIMQGVDMSGVGKRIRDSRVSRRMTHGELENAAHLPEGVTSVWESGKAYPPDEAFDKLAKALNTSVTWLLTGRQIAERDA
ncbi:helix-turn-helix domain-containing protein [Enterobacter asburiae]|uniref:helix-turn-helix domain-containing protein n=1 Tax=Enterobacter asburiae TaxID=61645 RepID=UPI001E53D62D|nr:helix-turn-helix domain-containing protein [Enterobacter asburiae]MCE2003118.1 hypothetical protein [Enterobacter asburiae]